VDYPVLIEFLKKQQSSKFKLQNENVSKNKKIQIYKYILRYVLI